MVYKKMDQMCCELEQEEEALVYVHIAVLMQYTGTKRSVPSENRKFITEVQEQVRHVGWEKWMYTDSTRAQGGYSRKEMLLKDFSFPCDVEGKSIIIC